MTRFSTSRAALATFVAALATTTGVNGLGLDDQEITDRMDVKSQTVEVHSTGDDMVIVINGKEISGDRIIETDRGMVVLDSDGEEMADFRIDGLTSSMVFIDADGRVDEFVMDRETQDEARPMLGISMMDGDRGVLITEVFPGTPAAQAGLRSGDEILSREDVRLDTERLAEKMSGFRIGQTVEMRILRDGEEMNSQVRLAPWNARMMERDEADREFDDRGDDRPEMERVIEMLKTVLPEILGGGDLEIDVSEDHEDIRIEVVQSSENSEGMEGFTEMLGAMIQDMLAGEMEDHGRDHDDDRHHEEDEHREWNHEGEDPDRDEHEGHHDGDEQQHHVERMLEEAWMDMKGWGSDMEEGLHEFIRDCDHRFHEFIEMADRRIGEVEEDLNRRVDELHDMRDESGERLGEMMQDRDRRIEDAFRDRDARMEEAARQFKRRVEEAGREIETTIRRVIESQARLAEQNRRLEARIERLERAIQNAPETKGDPRPNARNRNENRKAGDRDQERRRRRSQRDSQREEDA